MSQNRNTPVVKTDEIAEARAAREFQQPVVPNDYHNKKYHTGTCTCGESRLIWFEPENSDAHPHGYVICPDCGEDY